VHHKNSKNIHAPTHQLHSWCATPTDPPIHHHHLLTSVGLATGSPPLRLVLSTFDLDGTWLGLRDWTVQLQVCGNSVQNADAWTRFGTSYSTSCSVGVGALMEAADYSSNGPRLYDPYLVQDDGSLYPLPVKVVNRASGDQVGGSVGGWVDECVPKCRGGGSGRRSCTCCGLQQNA